MIHVVVFVKSIIVNHFIADTLGKSAITKFLLFPFFCWDFSFFGFPRIFSAFSPFFFFSFFFFLCPTAFCARRQGLHMKALKSLAHRPCSYLSGIGISTILDHHGLHQSPKTATCTPYKTPFPLAPLFSWLISSTPPQK